MKIIILLSIFLTQHTFAAVNVTTLHWGINLSPLEYFIVASKKFKEQVEKRTSGRVNVKLSIGEYKQEERDHLKDVSSGFYDMGQETVINLQKRESQFEIWNLPFLFKNDDHVFAYFNSKYGKKALASLSTHGVQAVDYTYSGGFLYTFGKVLRSISEFKNSLVAFEESASSFKDYLTNVLSVQVRDYGSYKGKMKQSEIISSTIHELRGELSRESMKNTYLNKTEHRVFSRVLFINDKFLSKLSEEDRKVVLEEAQKAAVLERELAVEETKAKVDSLKKAGMKVNTWSEKRKAEEKKLFAGYYTNYIKKHGKEEIDFINKIRN